jgi:hypothetical protein
MSQWSHLKYTCLAYLSQPSSDRIIYRAIRRHQVHSIVELGVGDARRTQRMIRVAKQFSPNETIRYTGVDLFEAQPANRPQIKLKVAYMEFKRLTPCVQLAPGDPYLALARTANSLAGTDLLVVGADQDPEAMARAWSFVPRMIHDRSLIFREEAVRGGRQTRFVRLDVRDVQQLADAAMRSGRKAA